MEQAIQAAIRAFVSEASLLDLCLAGMVGLLVWMLVEERKARRADALALSGHMDRHSASLEKLSQVLVDLRIAVAERMKR